MARLPSCPRYQRIGRRYQSGAGRAAYLSRSHNPEHIEMRYLILAGLLAAAAAPAAAAGLDFCDKPIAQLTVAQLDACQKMLPNNNTFRAFDEARKDALLDLARTVLGPEAVRDPRSQDRSR